MSTEFKNTGTIVLLLAAIAVVLLIPVIRAIAAVKLVLSVLP